MITDDYPSQDPCDHGKSTSLSSLSAAVLVQQQDVSGLRDSVALSNRPKASWNSSTWAWIQGFNWRFDWRFGDWRGMVMICHMLIYVMYIMICCVYYDGHDGHGHDGHEQHCALASVREMDLFDRSTWLQIQKELQSTSETCTPPPLQLPACKQNSSSLSDLSAQDKHTWLEDRKQMIQNAINRYH